MEALDYRMYRLELRSSLQDIRVARRMGKGQKDLYISMKLHYRNPSDAIVIPNFLQSFRYELDVLHIHEGAAEWFLSSYIR